MSYRSFLLSCVTLSLISACGGGGGGSDSPPVNSASSIAVSISSAFSSSSSVSSINPDDPDNDGLINSVDLDDDGDGVEDERDAFPLDSTESADFDLDAVGDNQDTDDDNDGVADTSDNVKELIVDLSVNIFPASAFSYDHSRNLAYVANKSARKLDVYDLKTQKVIKSFSFTQMPERIYLAKDKSILYVSLLSREHDSYNFEALSGSIAVIDLASMQVQKTLQIDTDPYDFFVTTSGILVVASGSGQWSEIVAYNASSGSRINSVFFRQQSRLSLHPSETLFYAANTDLSPSDFSKINITAGGVSGAQDSPYHGDHRINGRVWAIPDGEYVISKGGDLFNASDLTFVRMVTPVGVGIEDVVFDPENDVAALVLSNNTVQILNLQSMQVIENITFPGNVFSIALDNEALYILTDIGGVVSHVKRPHPCAACKNNQPPVGRFIWQSGAGTTADLFNFDASTSSDPESETLNYRWDINADGVWDTEFLTSPNYSTKFITPGVKFVRLQVKDKWGLVASVTKSFEVTQGVDLGLVPVDVLPNYFDFEITDTLIDSVHGKMYLTSAEQKRIYIVDIETGVAEKYFDLPVIPDRLSINADSSKVFVTLLDKPKEPYYYSSATNTGYISVIDATSGTLVSTTNLNFEPLDLYATETSNTLVVGRSNYYSNIYVFNADSLQFTNSNISVNYNDASAMAYTGGNLYVASWSQINKYSFSSGQLAHVTSSQYNGNIVGYKLWLSPDGSRLITEYGAVFNTANLSYVTSIDASEIENVVFDAASKTALLTFGSGELKVMNLQSYELFKTQTLSGVNQELAIIDGQYYLITEILGATSITSISNPCTQCASNTLPNSLFSATPETGTTATLFSFDGSGSSDLESGQLTYRWDLNGDNVWDGNFAMSVLASKKFTLPGSKTIKLQVKDEFGAVSTSSLIVNVTQGIDSGVAEVNPTANQFPFSLPVSSIDEARAFVYALDTSRNRLYFINAATGLTEKYISFEFLPEKMVMSKDGSKLYVTLLPKDRNSYTYEDDRSTYLAVVDLDLQAHTDTFILEFDANDMIASASDELIFIGLTRNYQRMLYVVDAVDGQTITSSSQYPPTKLVAVSEANQFIDVDYSYITKYDYSSGSMVAQRISVWEKQYYVGSMAWQVPGQNLLLTSTGRLISKTNGDVVKILISDASITYAKFYESDKIAVLYLTDGTLTTINLLTFDIVQSTSYQSVQDFGIVDEELVVVRNYYPQPISILTTAVHPCLDCATNQPPEASFSYSSDTDTTASVYTFDASASQDPEAQTLYYRWDFNDDNIWDSAFSTSATITKKFSTPGNKLIRLQIKDNLGFTDIYEQTISVSQGIDFGTVYTNTLANQFSFVVFDAEIDVTNSKLYVTDRTQKRLYVVNLITGFIERYFEFEYFPESVAINPNGSKLYLSLALQDHSSYWWEEDQAGYIAELDLENSSIVSVFEIDIDPADIALTNNKILVSSASGQWTYIHAYSTTTHELLGATSTYQGAKLAVDPNGQWLFSMDVGLSPSDIYKHNIQGVGIDSGDDSPYHGDYKVSGDIWVTPDGQYVLTRAGDVFRVSDMTYVVSFFTDYNQFIDVTFDVENNKMIAVTSENVLMSVDLTDLSVSLLATDQVNVIKIFYLDQAVYSLYNNSSTTGLRALEI